MEFHFHKCNILQIAHSLASYNFIAQLFPSSDYYTVHTVHTHSNSITGYITSLAMDMHISYSDIIIICTNQAIGPDIADNFVAIATVTTQIVKYL